MGKRRLSARTSAGHSTAAAGAPWRTLAEVAARIVFELGPRKKRNPGGPGLRLVSHKTRTVWFRARAGWPVREAPVGTLVRERVRAHAALSAAPGTRTWESIGPTNIGGRMTSIVADPVNPDRVWVGAAGSGVWFSGDAGKTWESQWHSQDVPNVGALAIDPKNPNLLYCGTGEANLSADSYPGVGVYQTLDAGKTWHLAASSERTGLPRRIGAIAIDPADTRHLVLGGVGFDEVSAGHDIGGMYASRDGGLTWKRETFVAPGNYWCHSVVFHPKRRGVIYATFTARGPASGIYRSVDDGLTWTPLRKGLPPGERFGRTSLAVSGSDPNTMYALAADEASARADLLLGVFRSTDGGASWANVAGTHFKDEGQMSYGSTIAVHPTDPAHVLCGGVDLHLSLNGGKTWRQVTHWDADRGEPNYAHADHHALLMPAAAPGRVYDPNDGGMDVSHDGGLSWTNRSNGLATTMFYDADVSQSDGRVFGGGAQDNGTVVTTTARPDSFGEILGGDGGWIVFDPADATHLFASYYNLNIFRFKGGRTKNVSPRATPAEKDATWMAYIAMDPTKPTTLFTGSQRVWRTKTDGDAWTPVSPPLDGSPISAIEIARADPRRILVGTENGGVFLSRDGGDSWSANLAGPLPGHAITAIAASPASADLVLAAVANFGHSHVFRSEDGGSTWEDADKGLLPDVPHHSLVIPPDAPETVCVASDAGVFVSEDFGRTWMALTRNLPNAMVVDLIYQVRDATLTAATYGRSMWRLQIK